VELTQALAQLEAAAAAVGRLLQDADEETVQLVAEAWAPLRPFGCPRPRWQHYWLEWLRECAERVPCANRAGATETPANGADWTTDWPQSFCDGVMQLAVSDTETPDSSVSGTHLRP
jgi:hypothetical protein